MVCLALYHADAGRVIAVDTRGLGDSDKPESGYDTQTVAQEFMAYKKKWFRVYPLL